MESSDPIAKNPVRSSQMRLGRRMMLSGSGLAAIVLLVVMIAHWSVPKTPVLKWLPGTPVRAVKKPSLWSALRLQAIRLVWPVWRHFLKPAPILQVQSSLMTLPPASNDWAATMFGNAVSTNAEGQVGWILSPEQFASVRMAFETNREAQVIANPRITTSSGSSAQIAQTGNSGDAFIVGLSPKVAGKAIRLGIAGEWVASSASVPVNLLKCQALVANGGALVVKVPSADKTNRNYLLLFNVSAVDTLGHPIKL